MSSDLHKYADKYDCKKDKCPKVYHQFNGHFNVQSDSKMYKFPMDQRDMGKFRRELVYRQLKGIPVMSVGEKAQAYAVEKRFGEVPGKS